MSHQSQNEGILALDLGGHSDEGQRSASKMLQRCRLALEELEQFQLFVKEQKRDNTIELAWFRNTFRRELKSLEKLSLPDSTEQKPKHTVNCSNFPFYDAVWATAKSCSGITALGRRFYWVPVQNGAPVNGAVSGAGRKRRKCSAFVDVVSQDGSEWVKVCTLTEKRILYDLAKAGWVGDSSSDESENASQGRNDVEDDEPEGLLKQAEALIRASCATRVRYRHPKVRLVLPRIRKNCQKHVFAILEKVRALGVTVQTQEDLPQAPPVGAVLDQLTFGDPFRTFSDVLNVDCTILLAFISDLSHGPVEPEDWHSKPLLRQIEMESQDQLMTNILWPACGARKLVCSREAANRMHEIVDTIGTKTEKTRTELLMLADSSPNWTREQRIEKLQEISEKEVPMDWNLPIEVVDVDLTTVMSTLPNVAEDVSKILASINQSVFLYGWAAGRTTITSNRTVSKEIEATIETHRKGEDDAGPDIWICPVARSLVGKEKQRRR